MIEPIDPAIRARAIAAAQGTAPFDRLLVGATVVDVATCELRAADVGIVGPMITSVHPPGSRADATAVDRLDGRLLAPGLIDAHVHFESSMMTPAHYAEAVLPRGTTTVFCDPHELANVLGLAGVRYAVEASRGLPLRFIVQAPSCVPSAPGLETAGAAFAGTEMAEMLSWPEVAGVAEVMDMRGVLEGSPRIVEILSAGMASGKLIEGHARGLSGPALQAYVAAGIGGDHEIVSAEDALEKLRAGLTVELRGSHDYLLPDVVKAINRLPVIPTNLTVCTDDVFPDYLEAHGGLDDVVRRLIRYGLDPIQAFRCATINSAYRLKREDLGLVAAGRRADLIVLSDLASVAVDAVYVAGNRVAADGRLLEPLASPPVAAPVGTVRLPRLSVDDFRVPVPGIDRGRAVVRAIRGARFATWSEVEVVVEAGFAAVPPGYSVLVAVHRHGRTEAQPQAAILEDWGEWRGALATTYSHDSHNLVVFGRNPADMAAAANALIEAGGGMAVAAGGRVQAVLSLPVAGILSTRGLADVAAEFAALRAAADQVADWQPPYRVFKAVTGACLACNAGPHLTDLGLTDGTTRQILPTLIRAA